MRMLVTGGAGFVGSNFVRRVLAGAYPGVDASEVVVLDKLTYAGTLGSLERVMEDPRLRFVSGDICDTALLDEVMAGVSLVVHFAAETHVDRSIADGSEFLRSNVNGTFALLDSALRAKVDKFVLVSTDEVYGTITSESWDEQGLLEPNSPYAATKGAADLIARAFYKTHGLAVCITRCCNNYGPYQFPEKLIPLFVTNLLDGETVPLYGDGSNVREWVHVDDHCAGIALVAQHGDPGRIYNIGSAVEMTNEQVTALVLKELGHDWSMVRFVEDRKGHDHRYSLDHTRIRTELGYRDQVPFRQGLADTVRWYVDNRSWWEPLKKRVGSTSA
ncbi:dTDP-glucose 4,6-dehydratase [Nocardiopsis ansamitocini]|uniref:dTDP-glucose 4,6-dehydratase n=1 Tax=Nocardiopsis ansamitocini TaxID=1670832 RepID=A0A9W6PAK2_9ACTN|nr:dTDP-glucose 4,6-dehydratase [Nocardiopsis ansamitocini]GLU50037.1 dTDP-glucose 4,6-dehydratase [Nocardiopsis ansamitocini]